VTDPLVQVREASFRYGDRDILRSLSIDVRRGEILSILGPNGCGKTTLLRCIAGALRLRSGTVQISGDDVHALAAPARARRIGFLFQDHSPSFPFAVADVVLMGRAPHLGFFGFPGSRDQALADAALERVGMLHLKQRPYTQVSGGERQLILLARILAGRNVDVNEIESFLDPTIKRAMPDPLVMTAMKEAAERITDAAMRAETVAIFGDYDVDGATSAALLARFLRECGTEPIVYIPDRLFEGYGPNLEAVRALAERGATLLVCVDCGTTSAEALGEAKARGLDVVVIDHHQADEELPPALAIVNPNRRDDLSGLGHLAAVGLTFMTVVAVNRMLRERGFWRAERAEPDLLGFLADVALGTVADVVPLTGLNRAFVAKGLIALRRRERPGHVSLMDVARLSGPPEAWHLGFLLGPRINAGGRIGRADLGVRLLVENDPIEAAKIAAELDRLNRERQAIEQETLAQAEAEADAALGIEDKGAVIVTAAEGWHPGIVGLVAARLKEKFGRPAFAIALEPGGFGTGSGRSIPGVDIGRAARRAVAEGLLVKGGGHAMAAGVTEHVWSLKEVLLYRVPPWLQPQVR